jgi:site-specific recombinase XerD
LFLADLSTRGPVVLSQLSAPVVVGYLTEAEASSPGGPLASLASAVRCFLRFLHVRGYLPLPLDQSVPRVAHPATDPPPKYLTPAQLDQLLGATDRQGAEGRRDYAILLCLARLGMRAGEVAHLCLGDVNWPQSCLQLPHTKGQRTGLLPLPQPVGAALVAYLRRERPRTALPQLFVSADEPPRAMTSNSVSKVVKRALARAGLWAPSQGAHLLRHTLATHLVQKGASLKAVADLLRHRQLQTTGIYAKVNQPMLAEVAQPWPEVGS